MTLSEIGMEFAILLLALVTGLTSNYAVRMLMRSPDGMETVRSDPILRSTLGMFLLPAVIAVLVWGLFQLVWWWVPLIFVFVSLFAIPMIFGARGAQRWSVTYRIKPMLGLLTLAAGIYLWISFFTAE